MSRALPLVVIALLAIACSDAVDRDSDSNVSRKDGGGETADGGTGDAGQSGCANDDECALGELCQGRSCVPGCTEQRGCAGSLTCCSGACVDTSTDEANCGGCGTDVCTGAEECVSGECIGGSVAKTLGVVSLFEAKGSVPSQIGTLNVTLLAPVVSFQKEDLQHDFDGRQNGRGCTADHFDNSRDPAPADKDAGTITISGYTGGSFFGGGGSSTPTMTCSRVGAAYNCTYTNGQPVATKPFGEGASPLGSGTITFSGAGGADFGSFTIQSPAPSGTLSVTQNLSSIKYSASQDSTLTYTCNNCGDSLVSVTILTTQNSPQNQTAASPTSGLISCLFDATGSFTIPKEAITAMFGNDSALKSVATTVVRVRKDFASAQDGQSQVVVGNAGRGVFGIAAR